MRYVETPRRARVRERGMTLIELMIVMLILSVTSEAIFSLVYASLKTYWKGDAATQAQQGARISVDRMTRDLKQARKLINGGTRTVGATSVTFNTGCTTPQISFRLPHLASISLADGSTVFDTEPDPTSGQIPRDGWDVSYYLAAASNSATPNTTGPFLIRAAYDIVGNTLTLTTVAGNVTGFALNPGGTCPTTSSREFTVQVTASQTQTGQNVSSQTIVRDDVTLRNQ